jgi:hypothetical protein
MLNLYSQYLYTLYYIECVARQKDTGDVPFIHSGMILIVININGRENVTLEFVRSYPYLRG